MSEKQWIPPVELEPEAEPNRSEEHPAPFSPSVLAEEGEEKFDARRAAEPVAERTHGAGNRRAL
jgi:hypothetical protein